MDSSSAALKLLEAVTDMQRRGAYIALLENSNDLVTLVDSSRSHTEEPTLGKSVKGMDALGHAMSLYIGPSC